MLESVEALPSVTVGDVEFSRCCEGKVVSHHSVDFFSHRLDGDYCLLAQLTTAIVHHLQGCHFKPACVVTSASVGSVEPDISDRATDGALSIIDPISPNPGDLGLSRPESSITASLLVFRFSALSTSFERSGTSFEFGTHFGDRAFSCSGKVSNRRV